MPAPSNPPHTPASPARTPGAPAGMSPTAFLDAVLQGMHTNASSLETAARMVFGIHSPQVRALSAVTQLTLALRDGDATEANASLARFFSAVPR